MWVHPSPTLQGMDIYAPPSPTRCRPSHMEWVCLVTPR